MTFLDSIKRGLTVTLASSLMVTAMSSTARAEDEPTAGTLAISNAPCDDDGTTSTDSALADQLNGVLENKLDGYMNAYRVSCARMIIKAVRERGMVRRAAVIAIDTAIVETGLQNHDQKVDHTSLGLFQQQDPWGSAADRLDPIWATNAFLNKMIKLYPNNTWQSAPVGKVAQDVQVSAYPERYPVEVADAGRIVDAVWDHALDTRPYDSFTGDAKADLIVHSGTDVAVRQGSGNGFADLGVVSSGWGRFHGLQITNGMGRLYFADYNADHRTDMIVHNGTDISVRLNTTTGWTDLGVVTSGWGRFHGLQITNGMGRLYFADYNADGRADMIVHNGTDISVRLNTTTGWTDLGVISSGWGRFHGLQITNGMGRLYFADYNADGRADMIVHNGTDISVRLNTTTGWTDLGVITSGWGRFHGLQITNGMGRLYFADIDGDGRADMIVHNGTDVSVRKNTPTGFSDQGVVTTGWGRFHGLDTTDGMGRLYLA
ncbi:FG-GAP repeat domain-containing protein [Actinoplanes teichomyceticus]|uniref:VCBS repeat protein n=1 Tax=Actinoplanes teichomyceticus TaxID=1867 RepID=A0A561VS20_ACTTI|nr:VCBS repeat-containing protein [Actinoplanes teichomyceticus]TWG14417.1 VCBS repeat protein [Actinoplanes teichomyceticus]